MIDVWRYYKYALDSEYARVLNMQGLHIVLNKILHNRYLTGFWICLEFWICQCYTGFCRKRLIILVGFLIRSDLNIQGLWICQGYTGFCVICILKIHGILNVLSSEYATVLNDLYMLLSKYVIVTKGSE